MQDTTTTGSVLTLDRSNFQAEVLESQTPVLIDFWAPWCGPCQMMKPHLAEAARQLQGQVRVGAVNVDEEPALSEAFGVRGIPMLALVQGTRILDAWSGVTPAADLVKRVREKLSWSGAA